MTTPSRTPDRLRRSAALAALVLLLAFAAFAVADLVRQPQSVVLALSLIAIVPIGVWYSVSRGGATGRLAAVVTIIGFGVAVAIVIATSGWHLLVRAAFLVTALLLGRYALGKDTRTLKSLDKKGVRVEPAKRPALIVNPRSGGAKARRFGLEQECVNRGIQPILLRAGDNIRAVAERAIEAGADAIGVAGGDGSLAAVASVAAAHDVPFVVVPAGTLNHFALDLGLDRGDVVSSLDAFGEAVERRVDVGEVNGRPFLNNVSLGLYASIVRLPEYRGAKIDTTLKELPHLLGPGSHASDLRFVDRDGNRHEAAHVLQVSNDPYGTHLLGADTRPHLDTGELGIISLLIPDESSEGHLWNALASGRPERYEGFSAWSTPSFEVTSASSIAAGIDGEAVDLEPPLHFVSRRHALRVRLPRSAIGYSPAARTERMTHAIPALWRVATGRAPSSA